jgi:hypothetical protein
MDPNPSVFVGWCRWAWPYDNIDQSVTKLAHSSLVLSFAVEFCLRFLSEAPPCFAIAAANTR